MTQLVDVSQSLLTQQAYEWSSHGIRGKCCEWTNSMGSYSRPTYLLPLLVRQPGARWHAETKPF